MKFLSCFVVVFILIIQNCYADESNDAFIFDGDDTFDKAENKEETDQEYDERFYRTARFLSIGMDMGYELFTRDQGKHFTNNFSLGFKGTYFFDFQIAGELAVHTSDHNFIINDQGNEELGLARMTNISLALKYFFNTTNLSAAITYANPHILFGVSRFFQRSKTTSGKGEDDAWSLNLGAGFEFPIFRERLYFGINGVYYFTFFNYESQLEGPGKGDIINLFGSITYYYF